MNRVDLHLHTTASDGELSPQEIVDLAIKKKLRAIAITDHDAIKGAAEAVEYARDKEIEVIPGIEISCYEKERGFEEVHVTGLFIDLKSKDLISFTEKIRLARIKQKKQIIKNLRMIEAVKVIKKAGGVSLLSHPGVYKKEDSLELIGYFLKCGGEGIETFYPYDIICGLRTKRSDELNRYYNALAKRMKILRSGGSDFHGSSRKKVEVGYFDIRYNIIEEIKKGRCL